MENETLFATLIAVTAGLTQILKTLDPSERLNRFYPLIVEVVGVSLGLLSGIPWLMALTIGLASMGLYRGAKVVIKGE